MKPQLFTIEAAEPSGRTIVAAYSEGGLLTGFNLKGEGWTDKMIEKAHKIIPLRTSDFAAFENKYKLKITAKR